MLHTGPSYYRAVALLQEFWKEFVFKWMGFNINLSQCFLNRKKLFTLQKLFIGYTC